VRKIDCEEIHMGFDRKMARISLVQLSRPQIKMGLYEDLETKL